MAGNSGGGAHATDALVDAVDGFVGGISLIELKGDLGNPGQAAEAPMPTYGYMRRETSFTIRVEMGVRSMTGRQKP